MHKFNDFIKENKLETEKLSFNDFLRDVKNSMMKDFDSTEEQAIEFTVLYKDLLKDAWVNDYTTREAIASSKRPGIMIKDDIVGETYLFEIDTDYEAYIEKIQKENESINVETYVNEYYNKFNKTYSDERIFERVKNNYNNLKSLASKRLFEMVYTKDNVVLDVDVVERNDELIDEVINKFSFVYKKKKDRYLRPIKITGKTLFKDTMLEIVLSNKDVIKITYNDLNDNEELKIHINDNLIYHMDFIDTMDIVERASTLYEKYLGKQNFKINKKTNPFE